MLGFQELMLVELESGERREPAGAQDRVRSVGNRTLAVEWSSDRESLRVTGEVDLATRDVWTDVLAASPGRLDLSGLSFVDVRGAVALADALGRSTTRHVTLYRPPPSLLRALDLFWSNDLPAIVIEDEEAR